MLFMSCVFMLLRLFIAALWSPAGKELTSWLLFVMLNSVFVTFPCGILGQVWNLIVSILDLCSLSNFETNLFPCISNKYWHSINVNSAMFQPFLFAEAYSGECGLRFCLLWAFVCLCCSLTSQSIAMVMADGHFTRM